MKKKIDKSYTKLISWSNEDRCFVGRIPGLIEGGIHGQDEHEVFSELCQVEKEAFQYYQEEGRLAVCGIIPLAHFF